MVRTAPPFGPKAPLVRCSQVSFGWAQGDPTAMPFCQHSFGGLWKPPVLSDGPLFVTVTV